MEANEISVTGDYWLGKESLDSVLNTLRTVLNDANESVKMTAYSLTYSKELFGMFEEILDRGINVTLVINQFDKKEFDWVRDAVLELNKKYEKLVVKKFVSDEGDLHAKIVVTDHQLENCQALIGSANLSWRAMSKNHEILIKLAGVPADTVGNLFELISDKAEVIPK